MPRTRYSRDSSDVLLRLPPHSAALVALCRRHGTEQFPFDSAEFQDPQFQKQLLVSAEQLSVLGLILVELARAGRLDLIKRGSGVDAGSHLRL